MQTYQCNLCLRQLELFSEWRSSGTPNAYLSQCLKHIFCEPCKIKIYPKCICKPQSGFMAINDQMPERYRTMFLPVQSIVQRIKEIEQFQAKQNYMNFHRMCQYRQHAQEIIDRIEQHGTIEQNRIGHHYLERCKSMHYLIKKRAQQKKKRRTKRKIPPAPAYGQRKFVFNPSRYRNVQSVSPRALEFSCPKTSNAFYKISHSR